MMKEPLFDDDDFVDFTDQVRRRGMVGAVKRWAELRTAEQAAALRAEYEKRSADAKHGYPPKIISLPDAEQWYPGPVEGDKFWPNLRDHLTKQSALRAEQIDLLDQASTKILAHTANPGGDRWSTQGLVVGFVQSGKTTNFTAVISKAIDVGYNLIVVLSGIHNGLRRQTQERLKLQLCSRDSGGLVELTTLDHDFRKPPHTLESVLPGHGERKAVLCVVKKNKAPLTKLRNWLDEALRTGGMARVKALIIDDEADQASIATPTINPLIRGILSKLPKRTFIGYTATPFANVLVGTEVPDDLYPKDFILNLPQPDGYFGPQMIFGRDEMPDRHDDAPVDGLDMVRTVPPLDAGALRPAKGRPFEPDLPDSLVESIFWFWLATAAKRSRDLVGHSTMLLHTSMKTAVHDAFEAPIQNLRHDVARQLAAGAASVTWVRPDGSTGTRDLRAFWEEESEQLWGHEKSARFLRQEFGLDPLGFDDVLPALEDVVGGTGVVLEHSRSLERLSYGNDPVTAIVIGGNTLSRGLTLEGLVVSYFIRSANAYDTLMQMGRWFGYRTGYEDLPRIYMTDELRKCFRHLAAVEEEIRLEIGSYEEQVMRPTDFGVRIRTHPKLLVTQKLGAAKQAYTSYGGRRLQVRYFRHKDADWLGKNILAASGLVEAAGRSGDPEQVAPGTSLWRDVPVAAVRNFLRQYEVHEDSPDMNREMLLKYIEKEVEKGSLSRWSVAVVGGDEDALSELSLGGQTFRTLVRSRLNDEEIDRADIKTLMSKDHRVLDLDITPAAARRSTEEALMNLRQADPVHKTRGLLILYPIDRASPPAADDSATRLPLDAVDHVVGLALVFPGDKQTSVENSYISADVTTKPVEDVDHQEIDDLINIDSESDDEPPAVQ